jgi:hypothetical protein
MKWKFGQWILYVPRDPKIYTICSLRALLQHLQSRNCEDKVYSKHWKYLFVPQTSLRCYLQTETCIKNELIFLLQFLFLFMEHLFL